MIGYITVGFNDKEVSGRFYDTLLGMMGATRQHENDRFIMWSKGEGTPGFAIITPADGKAATHGNGTMIGLMADDRAQVDAVHAKALELGGKDEGAPGERQPGMYFAYFRDPVGNKIALYKMG